MRRQVESIALRLSKAISAWSSVECVCLCEQSEGDVLAPYFALVLDVYHRGEVPAAEERKKAFGDPGAFESAEAQPKDRFFLEGLPVRVEYKSVERFDEFLKREADLVWILKDTGTYPFYRIVNSQVLYKKSAWIADMKVRLAGLPPSFWKSLREGCALKMEHYLADLGAAAMQDDGFFYIVSAAGFARYAAASLFCVNRSFEPSHRSIEENLRKLARLPSDFFGRWETFLRSDIEISREQKYKVAELIAKSIIALS
jgi:hypothetical protein